MKKTIMALAATSALVLAGCADTGKLLGVTGIDAPDEFLVVKQAPLTLPPNMRQLPVPREGAPSLGQKDNRAEAAEALFGPNSRRKKSVFAGSQASVGELALMEEAGVEKSEPEIRNLLRKETEALVSKEGEILGFLLGDADVEAEVDPVKENRRLQNNLSTGKDIGEGETPTLEEKRKYFIDYFF